MAVRIAQDEEFGDWTLMLSALLRPLSKERFARDMSSPCNNPRDDRILRYSMPPPADIQTNSCTYSFYLLPVSLHRSTPYIFWRSTSLLGGTASNGTFYEGEVAKWDANSREKCTILALLVGKVKGMNVIGQYELSFAQYIPGNSSAWLESGECEYLRFPTTT